MKKSLAREFNETSAAVDAAFPDKLGNLVVFLTPSRGSPVYVSPQIAEELGRNVAAVKKAVQQIEEDMMVYRWSGVSKPRYSLAGIDVRLIALQKDQRSFYGPGNTKEMWSLFVLDHELGHRILRNGSYANASSRHHAECAADAYAMLRHIQRFGKDTNFVKNYAGRRSNLLVLYGDTKHYSKFTVDRVIELARETDVTGLSLQETAELAAKIADDTHLDGVQLQKLYDTFRPVAEACGNRLVEPGILYSKYYKKNPETYDIFCRETLAVMHEHSEDPQALAVGRDFLTSFPTIRNFIREGAKTDTYWKEALAFINNPEMKMPGILPSAAPQGSSQRRFEGIHLKGPGR